MPDHQTYSSLTCIYRLHFNCLQICFIAKNLIIRNYIATLVSFVAIISLCLGVCYIWLLISLRVYTFSLKSEISFNSHISTSNPEKSYLLNYSWRVISLSFTSPHKWVHFSTPSWSEYPNRDIFLLIRFLPSCYVNEKSNISAFLKVEHYWQNLQLKKKQTFKSTEVQIRMQRL